MLTDCVRLQASKNFVTSLQSISTAVRGETQLQTSSLSFFKSGEQEAMIKQRIEELKKMQCTTETDELVTAAALEIAKSGADNSDGKPTKEQKEFFEENKDRVGEAIMATVEDDGFSVLQADEYLAVRTKPLLEEIIIDRMPPLSRKKKILQTLIYLSTGASVLLGTNSGQYMYKYVMQIPQFPPESMNDICIARSRYHQHGPVHRDQHRRRLATDQHH